MSPFPPNELANYELQLRLLFNHVQADILARIQSREDPGTLRLLNRITDSGDWLEMNEMNETDIALLKQKINQLRQIEDALHRIEAGTFGICVRCDAVIPAARIDAELTSEYCLACRKKFEEQDSIKFYNL